MSTVRYLPRWRVQGTTPWSSPGGGFITSTVFTVTGLAASTNYEFDVIADNGFGQSTSQSIFPSTSGGESAEGALITTPDTTSVIFASPTINQASGGPYTQFSFGVSPGQIQVVSAGSTVWTGGAVVNLVYHNHTLFQYAAWNPPSGQGWWFWDTRVAPVNGTQWSTAMFMLSSISLSSTTYPTNATSSTWSSIVTVNMNSGSEPFGGMFGGKLTLSDATGNFVLSGASGNTATLGVAAGHTLSSTTYTPSITASVPAGATTVGAPGGAGNVLTTSFALAAPVPTPPTPAPSPSPTPAVADTRPQAAINAGFNTVVFFDDFTTTTTVATTANATSGFNFYWDLESQGGRDGQHSVTTTQKATGSFASTAGGVLSVWTTGTVTNNNGNSILATIPWNSTAQQQPGSWHHGYIEWYQQFDATRSQANPPTGWIGCWFWPIPTAGEWTEIDASEYEGGGTFVISVHEWQNGTVNRALDGPHPGHAVDSNWHLYGMLWTGNGTTGALSFYFDGALLGSPINIGAGTNFINAEAAYYHGAMSGGFANGSPWPMNIDWYRVWQ